MDYQVVWRGIVHDSTGYSRASREYLLSLDRAGVDIKIEPMNFGTPPTQLEEAQAIRLNELIQKPYAEGKKKVLIYHAQPNGIDVATEKRRFDYVIINTVWETTQVPDNWFPSANLCDAIIVPSEQNVQALRDSGVQAPIFRVPHGADFDRFTPENQPLVMTHPRFMNLNGVFKFLSVFQWQHRKAPDALLKAYWSEFTPDDKVCLIVKTYWGAARETGRMIRNQILEYKNALGLTHTAPILVTTSNFSDDDIKGLYTATDCFVLPSRGEGVGLPYLEAMCSGKPVISTGWSGQMDFLNEGNAYLIDYELTNTRESNPLAPDFHGLFTDAMKWAEPDVDSLRKAMREAYENQEVARAKGEQGRKDALGMSWDNVGNIFKEVIERVIE